MLANGQQFPQITVPKVGGGKLTLPDDIDGRWGVVLIYRGGWCPYCSAQLKSFQQRIDDIHELGGDVYALSVDRRDEAETTVEKLNLSFAVGYDAELSDIVDRTGAYANSDAGYLESTDFLLNGDGEVVTAVYSSNAIGRFVPADVIGQIEYIEQS